MKMPFSIQWKLVTPALASQWLEKNTHNRNLRATTVDSFARDMMTSNWSINHQGIAFSDKDILIDGQHRLAAIVRSATSQWFVVFTGVPEKMIGVKTKVMDTVDRGNARSVADILNLNHGIKINAAAVAATCLVIARLCVPAASSRAKRASIGQTVEIMKSYSESLKFVIENRSNVTGLRSAIVAGAIAFAYSVDPKAACAFYKAFNTGIGLDHGSPALTLRNHVMSSQTFGQGAKSDRTRDAELVLHAIGCFRGKEQMMRIPPQQGRHHAQWWRDQQAELVSKIAALFPVLEGEKMETEKPRDETPTPRSEASPRPVLTEKDVVLTPFAESLIRGKEMSEKINRRVSARGAI